MTLKLTVAQNKALGKLTSEWQYPKAIGAHRRTLDALVTKGLAERCFCFNYPKYRKKGT